MYDSKVYINCVYTSACTTENSRSLGKANVLFDKVLIQWVDWVARASIQINGSGSGYLSCCVVSRFCVVGD